MSNRALSFVVLLLAIAFAAAPALTPQFTGYTADQLPVPQPDPLIQPPGWVFAVMWTVLYAWLLLSAGFGVLRRGDAPGWLAMRPPMALALALGTLWLSIATLVPIVAAFTIGVMTVTAIRALLESSDDDIWMQRLPNGLFAGWLTAATGVSLSIILAGFGVIGEGPAAAVSLLGVLAVALGLLRVRPGAWTYALGVGWALIGILVEVVPRGAWGLAALAVLGLAALGWALARDRGALRAA